MDSREIRKRFIDFFLSKQHKQIPSSSLVPANDPTVLFTTAGMQQLVPYLMGKEHPDGGRLCSVQKCVRTNDIDDVGDPRHLTFFEMLGNWSLGTYFKKESISMSFEFLTKHLEIPAEKLSVTVFEGQDAVPLDEESIQYWIEAGIPRERIFPLGAKDNWWPTYGAKGPCGPDTEIYYDTGRPKCAEGDNCKPGCDCDKYLEIWNNVFMEFSCDGEGNFEKLSKQNVDTGMGLERITMVLNGKKTVFETDLFVSIIQKIEEVTGAKYAPFLKNEQDLSEQEKQETKSIRIIADHIRSASFMIADGVSPSNEGRGYVLRRLIRRAIYNMRVIAPEHVGRLNEVLSVIEEQYRDHYPEIAQRMHVITTTVTLEIQKFLETIEKGEKVLNEILAQAKSKKTNIISGSDAFKLYDTFGFPISLTEEIAKKHGVEVDMDEYAKEMDAPKERSREGSKNMFSRGREEVQTQLDAVEKTVFLGYEEDSKKMTLDHAKVIKVISLANDEMAVILDKTVFYAESGGQVGDTGHMFLSSDASSLGVPVSSLLLPEPVEGPHISVLDTQKYDGVWVHFCKAHNQIKEGDMVSLAVDADRRRRIMANHTGAHLFHLALHEVLGEGADQAGSYVDEERMRFDFSYAKAVAKEDLEKIEQRVNELVEQWLPVKKEELSLSEAKARGAIGLFTEKYGDTVRVVTIGDAVSVELCGGTHIANTSEIGIAKIVKESSVASGIRRIEMITGRGVYQYLKEQESVVKELMDETKATQVKDLPEKVKTLKQTIKDQEVLMAELKMKVASGSIQEFTKEVVDRDGILFIEKSMGDMTMDEIKNIASLLRKEHIAEVGILSNTTGQFLIFSDHGTMTAKKVFDDLKAKFPNVKGGGNEGMVQGNGM